MKKLILLLAVFLMVVQNSYSKSPDPILVGSYNIRYENTYDGINSWSNRKEHVKALIQFHDWDIFGIQEGVINQVKGIAELRQYAWVGKGRDDGKEAGEHCAVYYKTDRFKMLVTGNFWLSETPEVPSIGWDSRLNKRICTWARFRDLESKKEFYFFCVHFDNLGAEARRQSAKLMVIKIGEIAKNMPTICVGDFNSTPETEQIATMQTLLHDAYKITEQPPYGPEGTSSGFGYNPARERRMDSLAIQARLRPEGAPKSPVTERPRSPRIDYIFVNDQVKVQKYGVLTDFYGQQSYPSDHFPIIAKITIN